MPVPSTPPAKSSRATAIDYAKTAANIGYYSAGTVASIVLAADLPYLKMAFNVLEQIVDICKKVHNQKQEFTKLVTNCRQLVELLKDAQTHRTSEKLERALEQTVNPRQDVLKSVKDLANKPWFQRFITVKKTETEISRCHLSIAECIGLFKLKSHLLIHETFQDLMVRVDKLGNNQQELLAMTESIRDCRPNSDPTKLPAFNQNFARFLDLTEQQLPQLELTAGDYQRLEIDRALSTRDVTVRKATYLDKPGYIVKSYLRVANDPDKNIQRFRREAKIWSQLWDVDKGKHIAPIVGYNLDGEAPDIVTRHYEDTAWSYVSRERNPPLKRTDYNKILRSIASGIAVLHHHDKPIIHGNIRGETVAMDPLQGLFEDSSVPAPLLANFELSKIMEGVNSEDYTATGAQLEWVRWFSPETLEEAKISTKSDVWSFGMTILELFTHKRPYHEFTHARASSNVMGNILPKRPTQPEVVERGLDDEMWKLICDCCTWDPEARPDINEVLARL